VENILKAAYVDLHRHREPKESKPATIERSLPKYNANSSRIPDKEEFGDLSETRRPCERISNEWLRRTDLLRARAHAMSII